VTRNLASASWHQEEEVESCLTSCFYWDQWGQEGQRSNLVGRLWAVSHRKVGLNLSLFRGHRQRSALQRVESHLVVDRGLSVCLLDQHQR